ncbi:MAG: hypothetical protein HYR56_01020 [Acidobacteria bacterium]|nr:hypothetical protein [Acidobacteriota bacterium]MBI3426927.1 hypothetical protein [Acidobacteriota bacterium]
MVVDLDNASLAKLKEIYGKQLGLIERREARVDSAKLEALLRRQIIELGNLFMGADCEPPAYPCGDECCTDLATRSRHSSPAQ